MKQNSLSTSTPRAQIFPFKEGAEILNNFSAGFHQAEPWQQCPPAAASPRGAPEPQPEPGTAAGRQLCCQHWDSTSTSCTQSQLELQLHFGLPSNFTTHEMHFTCWLQSIPAAPVPPTFCVLCRPAAPQCASASALLLLTFPLGTLTKFWHPLYVTVPHCGTDAS